VGGRVPALHSQGRLVAAAAIYIVLAIVWIYAVLDNPDIGDRANRFDILLVIAAVYAFLGATIARWGLLHFPS
jgi:hypothetical protein